MIIITRDEAQEKLRNRRWIGKTAMIFGTHIKFMKKIKKKLKQDTKKHCMTLAKCDIIIIREVG